MNRFDYKRVFVTGAASGIGQATALRLASEGASLCLTDLNEEGLAETAAQCAARGAEVETRRLDVADEAAVGAAIPHLIASGGNIVNCGSTTALAGAGYSAVYGASKAAVCALTRGIAVEFAKKGVRCNTIVPGEVATPMVTEPKLPDDPDFTLLGRMAPLDGQNATPDQIASAIAMLASDDGAYINGAEIRADGGGLS